MIKNHFLANSGLVIWGGLLAVIIIVTLLASWLAGYPPTEVHAQLSLAAPDGKHLLGTDNLGRDVLSRILYGGRVSLSVAIFSVVISAAVGLFIGGLSGYFGGWFDSLMMRILEAFLAIPTIVVVLALQSVIQGGVVSLILIIGLTGWMTTARIVRSQFIELKQSGFVKMAYVLGTPPWKIVFVHLFRNSLTSIIVVSIFNCAGAIFTEVTLSFLGIGIPPDLPSWGNMLEGAQNSILIGAWWVGVFPGVMIVLTLLAINFIGESLNKKFLLQRM